MTDPDGQSSVSLSPRSGKALNLVTHGHVNGVDWLRLQSNGKPGALRATGFVVSPEDGHPRLTRFYDPAAPVQQDLFATGLPVENINLTIALKNTSSTSVVAAAEFLDLETGVHCSVPTRFNWRPEAQHFSSPASLIFPESSGSAFASSIQAQQEV